MMNRLSSRTPLVAGNRRLFYLLYEPVTFYQSSRQDPCFSVFAWVFLLAGCRRALDFVAQKDLTYPYKCCMILVSSWQTVQA